MPVMRAHCVVLHPFLEGAGLNTGDVVVEAEEVSEGCSTGAA